MSVMILKGTVTSIVDTEKRIITATSDYGHGTFTGTLLFTPHNIEVEDKVIILIPANIAITNAYFIPLSDKTEHGLDKIKLHFTPESTIDITENDINIKHKDALIHMTEDGIEISYKQNTFIKFTEDRADYESKEINIVAGQKIYVPGLPDTSNAQPKGGFSRIPYCPFTGVVHTTDTMNNTT
jgi:hypothetical protein